MAAPEKRSKILPARGSYQSLLQGLSELLDGEICYAVDQDRHYQKEGGNLVAVGASKEQGAKADAALPASGGSITGALNFNVTTGVDQVTSLTQVLGFNANGYNLNINGNSRIKITTVSVPAGATTVDQEVFVLGEDTTPRSDITEIDITPSVQIKGKGDWSKFLIASEYSVQEGITDPATLYIGSGTIDDPSYPGTGGLDYDQGPNTTGKIEFVSGNYGHLVECAGIESRVLGVEAAGGDYDLPVADIVFSTAGAAPPVQGIRYTSKMVLTPEGDILLGEYSGNYLEDDSGVNIAVYGNGIINLKRYNSVDQLQKSLLPQVPQNGDIAYINGRICWYNDTDQWVTPKELQEVPLNASGAPRNYEDISGLITETNFGPNIQNQYSVAIYEEDGSPNFGGSIFYSTDENGQVIEDSITFSNDIASTYMTDVRYYFEGATYQGEKGKASFTIKRVYDSHL